jgi:hypothetical protein
MEYRSKISQHQIEGQKLVTNRFKQVMHVSYSVRNTCFFNSRFFSLFFLRVLIRKHILLEFGFQLERSRSFISEEFDNFAFTYKGPATLKLK